MPANSGFYRYTWFVLIFVFIVITAGGVVRMTQSGMGCPDWPKCFGRWTPPVNASQLPADFEKYLSRQDIDHTFNPYHTWIEYINRLLGAILGVLIFVHTIWSFRKYRKSNPAIFYLSLFLLLAVAFQGWLGKKVVDANLAVVKVTVHMLVALVIAAIPVLILSRLRNAPKIPDRLLRNLTLITLVLLLVQIVLGTEVREQVDFISRSLAYKERELWIERLDSWFIVHRSFSWIVGLGAAMMVWKSMHYVSLRPKAYFIFSLVLVTAFLGLLMNYLNIPAIAQPLHLLTASILAIALFAFRLRLAN